MPPIVRPSALKKYREHDGSAPPHKILSRRSTKSPSGENLRARNPGVCVSKYRRCQAGKSASAIGSNNHGSSLKAGNTVAVSGLSQPRKREATYSFNCSDAKKLTTAKPTTTASQNQSANIHHSSLPTHHWPLTTVLFRLL